MIIFFLFFTLEAGAFVITKTIYNRDLKWDRKSINFIIDPSMSNQSSSLTEENVVDFTNEVFDSWGQYTNGLTVSRSVSNSPMPIGSGNSLRFSSDPAFFGSGVLAVTSVVHSASTGEIFSADILINDTFYNQNRFSINPEETGTSSVFLKDVISHEVGHFLGLGHSDVPGATMMFNVFKDQASLHSDDIRGIASLYDYELDEGVIRGRVAGGDNIGVFAAQVQAISVKTGKVISATLSSENGSFEISNLPVDDSYILYILPSRDIKHLPDYYSSAQENYCNGNSYVPSFFNKCGGSSRGYPQVINLERLSNIDVGNVTIKCDESLPTDYLLNKTKETRDSYQINMTQDGEIFHGYFSAAEVSDSLKDLKDKFRIDLSHVDTSDGSYFMELRVLVSEIGSNMAILTKLESSTLTSSDFPTYDSLGKIETNNYHYINLSASQSDNIFELEINPRSLSSSEARGLFGSPEVLTNSNMTYLVIVNLSRLNSSGTREYVLKDSYPILDNSSCLTSNITVETMSNTPFTNESSETDFDPTQSVTCGTVDIDDNGGPGGMMSFVVGFLCSFSIVVFRRKKNDFFV